MAGDIYPILDGSQDYDRSLPTPSREMLDAWADYRQNAKSEAAQNLFAGQGVNTAPQKLSLLDRLRAEKRYAVPSVDRDGFFVREQDWYLLVRNIVTRTSTMMTGPSGCGKTELIALAAERLGLELSVYNMGTMLDPVSGLLGVHRLVQGGSVFDYARFTQDIAKPGVVLLDELSRAPQSASNILLPCLDSRRELPVDIAGGNGVRNIPVHPDCVFIATANVGAEYTGTSQMDRALTDRFFIQEIGYMDAAQEAEVLSKRCGIESADAKIIVETARTVRSLYAKGELGSSLSTRETLGAGRLVADGWSVLEAMEHSFLPFFEGYTRTTSLEVFWRGKRRYVLTESEFLVRQGNRLSRTTKCILEGGGRLLSSDSRMAVVHRAEYDCFICEGEDYVITESGMFKYSGLLVEGRGGKALVFEKDSTGAEIVRTPEGRELGDVERRPDQSLFFQSTGFVRLYDDTFGSSLHWAEAGLSHRYAGRDVITGKGYCIVRTPDTSGTGAVPDRIFLPGGHIAPVPVPPEQIVRVSAKAETVLFKADDSYGYAVRRDGEWKVVREGVFTLFDPTRVDEAAFCGDGRSFVYRTAEGLVMHDFESGSETPFPEPVEIVKNLNGYRTYLDPDCLRPVSVDPVTHRRLNGGPPAGVLSRMVRASPPARRAAFRSFR